MLARRLLIIGAGAFAALAVAFCIDRYTEPPFGRGPMTWDRVKLLPKKLDLEGRTKEEVLDEVGAPPWIEAKRPNCWIYELRPAGLISEAFVLGVEFGDDDRVSRVSVWETPYTDPKWGFVRAWSADAHESPSTSNANPR